MKKRTRTTPDATLPTLPAARKELLRREARAFVWMFVRLVGIGALLAILTQAVPAFQRIRPLLDGIAGVLILAPLFTGLGRAFGWRIALGKAYVAAERFADAEQILIPLSGLRARLFDVAGEGRCYRATALAALGRPDEARLLFQEVADRGTEPWRSEAAEKLTHLSARTENGGTASTVAS